MICFQKKKKFTLEVEQGSPEGKQSRFNNRTRRGGGGKSIPIQEISSFYLVIHQIKNIHGTNHGGQSVFYFLRPLPIIDLTMC